MGSRREDRRVRRPARHRDSRRDHTGLRCPPRPGPGSVLGSSREPSREVSDAAGARVPPPDSHRRPRRHWCRWERHAELGASPPGGRLQDLSRSSRPALSLSRETLGPCPSLLGSPRPRAKALPLRRPLGGCRRPGIARFQRDQRHARNGARGGDAMTGIRPTARKALKLLPLLLLMGNKPACDNQPLTLSCDTVSVQVDPGTCVDLENPCGDHTWVRLDAFRLCDDIDGLFVQTQREPRARQLCADARVGTLMDEPFDFYYSRPGDAGVGTLRITAGSSPLTVTATATPPSIPPGGASQLEAAVRGGQPPYS